jgi:predicted glutamine amidotransferase
MCRIFAYSGEVGGRDFVTAVTQFGKLAKEGNVPQGIAPGHLDGWGAHATTSGREVYARSVTEATPDDLTAALCPLGAGVGQALIHLRKATVGANRIENAHPFLRGGVSLCHNGSIRAFPDTTTLRNPHGDTDSERFFLRILERVSREDRHSLDALGAAVEAEVESLTALGDWTSLTCLLKSKQGFVLKYIWNEGHPMTEAGRLNDYYTFYKGVKGSATILCSEKLDVADFVWEPLLNGTLLTVPVTVD